jgi:hypothetical protein
MIGLLCFALAVLASPFKSRLRLEAENAVLRHQLMVLRRALGGRVRITYQHDGGSVRVAVIGDNGSPNDGFHVKVVQQLRAAAAILTGGCESSSGRVPKCPTPDIRRSLSKSALSCSPHIT